MLVIATFLIISCSNETAKTETNTTVSDDKPLNPDVKTDYGALPDNYTTQDEYYINSSGNKVWHGHRKTFYPGGRLRFDAYYEHGNNLWNKKYDTDGNQI